MPRVALLFGAVLAFGTLAGPAHADTWSSPDRVGDVGQAAFSDEPPPCGSVLTGPVTENTTSDIVALTVEHTAADVVVTIALRDVRRRNELIAQVNIRTSGPDYEVTLDRIGPDAELFAALSREPRPPRPSQVSECGDFGYAVTVLPCAGLAADADPATDVLRVTVPRGCVRKPRWVRVGASVQGVEEPYPGDQWGVRKNAPRNNFLVNPLGPRVHAAAP